MRRFASPWTARGLRCSLGPKVEELERVKKLEALREAWYRATEAAAECGMLDGWRDPTWEAN